MKNLKTLFENYLNEDSATPNLGELHKTFVEAEDFREFRRVYGLRAKQARRRRALKNALVGVVAASVLLICAFWFLKKQPVVSAKPPLRKDVAMVDAPRLVNDHFENAYRETISNVRKDANATETDWTSPYAAGRFEEAARLIEAEGVTASSEAKYCLAICYIRQNQFEKAIIPLQRIAESDPKQLKTFTPEARWLLANVYWRLDRVTEARVLLQRFVDEGSPRAPEAKAMLESRK